MSQLDYCNVCPPLTLTVCCALFLRRFLSPLLLLLQLAATTASAQHSQLSLGDRRDELAAGPLRLWRQDRYVRCIFCMNYDDYNNLSTFGCELRRVATCTGNICYMRQHKRPEYFLYTSGCLNLTRGQLAVVRSHISAQSEDPTTSGTLGNETQLCEVGTTVNTCICASRSRCNNVTSVEPFVEFAEAIFTSVNFDELAHFRYLLPNDPILEQFERDRTIGGSYYLVRDSAITTLYPSFLITIIIIHKFFVDF